MSRIIDLFRKKKQIDTSLHLEYVDAEEMERALADAIYNYSMLLDNNCRDIFILDTARDQIVRIQRCITENEAAKVQNIIWHGTK
jgi:hypothetical protein